MNTVYAREDYLGADEYIDVVRKSGLNRPVEDRGRVERMLAHANLILTARQDGRLVGFARSLTDFSLCCYLSDLAVDKACQGQGIGKRLIAHPVRRKKGRGLAIPQCDGAGFVEQQHIHIARRFDRLPRHRNHIGLHHSVHAGNADCRKQSSDRRRDQTNQQRD